jgi:hypothetical protein
MMPTFPRSPLSFRTAGFPRYGCKAGLSDGTFPAVAPLKSAPDIHIATTGLHPSFVHSAARAGSPYVSGPQARSCTAMKWRVAPQPQGSSLGSGLFCPGPSSLNRPHPPHSQAHRDFAALRFIRDAFAVRERLGDPRVVPSFRWLFLPDMPSSASPVSSNIALSKVTMPTRSSPRANWLDTHETPQSDSRGRSISGLTGSPLLRPVSLLASPVGSDRDGYRRTRGFYVQAFSRAGRPPQPLDMTTTSIGLLCRRDLHPLE